MSRYTKQHYEDVARLLAKKSPNHPAMIMVKAVCEDFADLFAADNPPVCIHCGQSPVSSGLCLGGQQQYLNHEVKGGFNPKQFLAACGLETTRPDPRCEVGSHDGPCTSACIPERSD
ncbi:hypothetical protein LCGC14_2114440 [marine sediment metagenome]|uniref:Uncharacterized protein n=1 Tax=marine sediment metagenome TaxID=412755 RepID=A0A0F9E646_9ZZZZ